MKRFIIAGTHSGCGKTTVTCAILKALSNRGLKLTSFKCGPDYIDPMFHERITGQSAYNLDSFFCDDGTLNFLLHENGKNSDVSVIEGVMGYYDGVGERGSAYSVARLTGTPAVIVIDCKGMSDSIGAVMKGFTTYREQSFISGFIFNRLPERLIPLAKRLCSELGVEYFGCMPINSVILESRRLGLVTANEVNDLDEKISVLGKLADQNILIDKLLEMSDKPFPPFQSPDSNKLFYDNRPTVAVAKDSAFCFIYRDNIALLERIGCKIEYFSPLNDSSVPKNTDGLILSGGYPELYAKRLSENREMLSSIKKAVLDGMPTIAECGGFMYLHKTIEDSNGIEHNAVGLFDANVFKTDKLRRFGYITMTAAEDNLLCEGSQKIAAHEFHYYDSTDCGHGFTVEKSDGRSWECGICTKSLYAGFPHIYFYSDVRIAERFVRACVEFGGKNEQN